MGAVLEGAGNAAAMDIKYGDGKMFGLDLVGDKNVAALSSKGLEGDNTTIFPQSNAFSILS